ncbi:sigma-70 family RNA polymerase sigma factor [Cohnella sp. REN36]|uniref:sigma-70 family RNA polymerase sigma factor n=1 Tax=Cohnella sp. REN36 TaxID=2887347 RepID=UPI001D150597|nr:sigma-70 family RNA polymerase sigma factor [Cohnella sp. REN36]MCC3373864.1 sigma-70 family RNA polymerase sigma factor [Cohnella sp. REN36]
MDERNWLAEQFESHRAHLQGVAYRMLGSLSEADDAVQESWLRLSRSDQDQIDNLGGWLTTVVSRVCLDMLRSRKSRREDPMTSPEAQRFMDRASGGNPEQEAILADSVGLALLVVLGNLNPVERIAFVLHDIFAVPFTEIAPIIGRSEMAVRQLASRARRRVQGTEETARRTDLVAQKALVDAFLAAARNGDFESIIEVLDPEVVLRSGRTVSEGNAAEIRGARDVAKMLMFGRARAARPALVNGEVGILVAPRGHLLLVLALSFAEGKIVGIEQVDDPARLAKLDLAHLGE